MQPAKIKITDEEIDEAEKILLSSGGSFDAERRKFIKNLETIDLQAVPGSGKTTALLAKLLILENNLPFNDGSGILVISHTNAAVNEIKNKIERYCPKLFSYPNFIGTIQEFVNHFLALPQYSMKFGRRAYRIDNDIFFETFQRKFPKRLSFGLERSYSSGGALKSFICNLQVSGNELISSDTYKKTSPRNAGNTTKTYRELVKFKIWANEEGFLNFNDTYFFASKYLKSFPKIKNILQQRFALAFVDEMQDMHERQYQILEEVFYAEGKSISKYQRIGDKNQAIYNYGGDSLSEIWENRDPNLFLEGSHRLTKKVASTVQCFGITPNPIKGKRGYPKLKPHIIVFDNPLDVIPKFADLISKNQLNSQVNPFHAVGWRTKHDDEDKLGIKDYFPNYERKVTVSRTDFSNLRDYLQYYDKNDKTLASIKKNLLRALVRILRMENLKDEKGRNFTVGRFMAYLRGDNESKYENFKLKLFEWSLEIRRGRDVYKEIKQYLTQLITEEGGLFNKTKFSVQAQEFINSQASERQGIDQVKDKRENNVYKKNGVMVRVGTVHSVKGSTHTATLYMETYYHEDGRGKNAKSYESQRLRAQFYGRSLAGEAGKRTKQSAKIAYVGFSRPTHLLCVAVHKERFNQFDKEKLTEWEIINIS